MSFDEEHLGDHYECQREHAMLAELLQRGTELMFSDDNEAKFQWIADVGHATDFATGSPAETACDCDADDAGREHASDCPAANRSAVK